MFILTVLLEYSTHPNRVMLSDQMNSSVVYEVTGYVREMRERNALSVLPTEYGGDAEGKMNYSTTIGQMLGGPNRELSRHIYNE